jgi:hypothetical protein
MSGYVAWQHWASDWTPGRWTKTHITRDDKTTLCGRQIPGHNDCCDSGPDGDGDCKRCRKAEEKAAKEKTAACELCSLGWDKTPRGTHIIHDYTPSDALQYEAPCPSKL